MKTHEHYDYLHARLAVDKAKLCPVNEHGSNPRPRVAIVIASKDAVLGWCAKGYGGEIYTSGTTTTFTAKNSDHAEQLLLSQLMDMDLSAASAYVTLEPCTERKGKIPCCADLIVRSGLKRIFIGNCDPNPSVGALAWQVFFKHDIAIFDFPPELRNEARRDNNFFFRKFTYCIGPEGQASFDYLANGGSRTISTPQGAFVTKWTNRADKTIYAVDHVNNVAVAKNCTEFSQIDDPSKWFEDSHYTKAVDENQIVIFRTTNSYALIKIINVRKKTKDHNAELKFEYQVRHPAES